MRPRGGACASSSSIRTKALSFSASSLVPPPSKDNDDDDSDGDGDATARCPSAARAPPPAVAATAVTLTVQALLPSYPLCTCVPRLRLSRRVFFRVKSHFVFRCVKTKSAMTFPALAIASSTSLLVL